MLWQHSRRSLVRRTLKFHRAARTASLEELFQGQERTYRRPRTKGRGDKERGPERK